MSLKFKGGYEHQRGKGIGGFLRKNKETNNDNIDTYTKVSKVKKGKKKNPIKIDGYVRCKKKNKKLR